jgi:hypothetical protein
MNMFKKIVLSAVVAGALAMTGCASGGSSAGDKGGADVFGTRIYLRGEMNDWAASGQYLINKVSDGVYVATAELKVDWAPYKFKFADAGWTAGTNFGYKDQPGIFEFGGAPVTLNPKSIFEEVKVTPPEDGLYDFYIDVTGEEPVTYVKKHGEK